MEKRIEEMNKTVSEIKEVANNSFKEVEEKIDKIIQQENKYPDIEIDLENTLRNMRNVDNLIKLIILTIIAFTASVILVTVIGTRGIV